MYKYYGLENLVDCKSNTYITVNNFSGCKN